MIQRCPICNGKGWVPSGFYDFYGQGGTACTEPCRACGGRGFIEDNPQTGDVGVPYYQYHVHAT